MNRPPHLWEIDTGPGEVPLSACPEWLLKGKRSDGDRPFAEKLPPVIKDGKWHKAMVSAAGTMRARGFTEGAAVAALLVQNAESYNGVHGDDGTDIRELVADVYARYEQRREIEVERAEPWDGEVPNGAELLDEIEAYIRRYMRMSDEAAAVCALFVLLTYVFELLEVVPYLRVSSATKRSGKSRLLDVFEFLVRAPLASGGMSEASLFRSLAEKPRTLLFDEIGKVLGEATRDKNSDLARVFLNGYAAGKPVQRCVGEGTKQTVVDFEVYGPKVLCGTGQLDDQILDRCLPIELRRKKRDEPVARFRRRQAKQECEQLRARIGAWADAHGERLRDARPHLPEALDDRGQDIAEPLLGIADLAGEQWATRAREAVVTLRGGSDELEEDVGVELLADIREAFGDHERLTTDELLQRLTANPERPWAHWKKGLPMNALQLARKLRPFGVKPKVLRVGGATPRGYERAVFDDAFSRYVPVSAPQPATPATSAQPSQKQPFSTRNTEGDVAGTKSGANPHEQTDVAGVAGTTPEIEGWEEKRS